ncbi:LuxR C-terminal-related transcriptional regulator [Halomonas elongata]|uniref:helix-turn-helix transcriptional regulator n=1 Tax=Halomonas elongata TaxID=2746 RepID=UPI00334719AD
MTCLSTTELASWNEAASEAMAHCHADDFPAKLLEAIDTLVPLESTLIILEDSRRAPELLYKRGIPPHNRERVIDRYFSRGYLLDPFCLAVDQGLAEGFYHLDDIAPDNFFNSEYYRVYYLEAGSVEDCYYILDLTPERRISISLYNGLTATPFTPTQRAILQTLDPMVRTLARYHWQNLDERVDTLPPPFAPSPGGGKLREAFLRFGEDRLTMREREICHLLLRGHSAKSSARELSISPETVRLHRKNLYAKFDIGSQSALFAIFLDWLDG